MKRVTGIGGICCQARDPAPLAAWYRTHLGIDVQSWGGAAFDRADDSEYGKFGWVMDPEGNKVERWEPPAGG
ncbi:MAG: hypothetical protein KGL18_17935 [Burkholderiales bacterium]|nr:hypothetical protein [Burkholderiales bacterium]MDE1927415.1 hypothetical protein [Burkholderiales bacterium]MDE2161027.1 hypothetical protein [Burkholderiales bacterium]MDE2504848.1 hypothetical protein [Burkholderiales bacterium]